MISHHTTLLTRNMIATKNDWSWTVERGEHDVWILSWWPRGDNYGFTNTTELSSYNFLDACAEAKYFLNIE
jgi:hypothetical protein